MSENRHSDRLGYASDRFGPSSSSGHEDVDTARKAAEALFAPKRPIADPTLDSTGSTQENARKPRILSAVREPLPVIQAAHRERTKPPVVEHETRRPRKRVPASHLARVRTWLNYGMTINQAADMYGVSVSEIERLLL
jgi:hypothetical protein